jgi:nicotinate-nucleotide adenylyltransferase
MKTGLFFGSFNPVHNGHLAIAEYFIENTSLEQLWFVISPQNPLKDKSILLPAPLRLKMLELAISSDNRFKICDIEFQMPQPSYTTDTLKTLSEKYPLHEFVIIMGSDGLATFDKWKNYEQIVKKYHRFIYPRPFNTDSNSSDQLNCTFFNDAPMIDISSSKIRKALKDGKDAGIYVPDKVFQFIREELKSEFFR